MLIIIKILKYVVIFLALALVYFISCLTFLPQSSPLNILVLPSERFDLEDRHKSGGSYKDIVYDKDFKTYKESVIKMIIKANPYSEEKVGKDDETVLELIQPFEWPSKGFKGCADKNKKGLLLIHGLTDTPFLMRDIGKHFEKKNCFLIRSILLPGHGTVPGDLLDVDDDDWMEATSFGIKSFNGKVSSLYIGGFSTGGGLAVNYMLDEKNKVSAENVKGLLLFSPAIKIGAGLTAVLADWHSFYSLYYLPGKWIDIAEDKDFAKYESFAKNAADQIHELTTIKRWNLNSTINVPVFIAISADDATVESRETIEFFEGNISDNTNKKMILYMSDDKSLKENCKNSNIDCKPSNYPEENILSYSHTALPVAKNNFHYGTKPDSNSKSESGLKSHVFNCLHYINDNEKIFENYNKCSDSEEKFVYRETKKGEFDKIDVDGDVPLFRRLTFNPDFENMMEDIDMFFNEFGN